MNLIVEEVVAHCDLMNEMKDLCSKYVAELNISVCIDFYNFELELVNTFLLLNNLGRC
jgi:hypothetical protein